MTIPQTVKPYWRQTWKPLVVEEDGTLTHSKFSGKPFLKKGETWPFCPNCGKPMQLFVQLNLDTLPEPLYGEFGRGILQMFYCVNRQAECEIDCEAWSPFAQSHYLRIVEAENGVIDYDLPIGIELFPPKLIVNWQERNDYPNWEELQGFGIHISDEDEKSLFDQGFPTIGDKLAGWPFWVQSIEYPNCPICKERMRFVFQIESEDNLPFMFGDCGCGHITQCKIHKEQLAFRWACY